MPKPGSCYPILFLLLTAILPLPAQSASPKPKLTLDEFFNAVSFPTVKLSPDANSVVIETERADWDRQIFRKELWLYRVQTAALLQLTQSGHDTSPQWSPDGQWIAFLSERKPDESKDEDAGDARRKSHNPASSALHERKDKADDQVDDKADDKDVTQLFLISPNGGEAFPVTSGEEEVHDFAWSADSKTLYFATRQPWTKQQTDDHKKEWKDVLRYRADERGDVIFRLDLAEARARHAAQGAKEIPESEKDSGSTPGAVPITQTPLRIQQMVASHNGKQLAFVTSSISERQEKVEDIEIYLANLNRRAPDNAPIRLTRNQGGELDLEWSPDDRHIFFRVDLGSVEGKYEDVQPRLYWLNVEQTQSPLQPAAPIAHYPVERWFADFPGEVTHYTQLPDGSVLCACRQGTEVQLISQSTPKSPLLKRQGWPGTYEKPSTAAPNQTERLAFVHSSTARPMEIYLADSAEKLAQAKPITSFNQLFTERDLPQGKRYSWTSTDGTAVEGMLMYPPGKFEQKNLPMFVLIHGGPQDADGDRFEADWYQWDRLAATAGWLVFEPNYRGSTGYGDQFTLQIVPEIVSRPGKDILSGVDALVKDGIADPNQLAVGGYSYGGYMTNWLITQTTRFKAAVTGAGAVEHVANWGNDDTTFDDAFFLGGPPWQAADRYRSEAAIFQIEKVRTPTHMVAGADDIRVSVLEDYLLDRALHELNVPGNLLIFPGEGHSLAKNPWHGKIKVREELMWLEKYGGAARAQE